VQDVGFVGKHKPEWDELEALVQRARKGIRRLSAEEVSRIDLLYRRTSVHLAQVSTRTRDVELIRYLNDLVAGAHSVIYLPPRRGGLLVGIRWLLQGFAQSVARTWRFHALSGLLMLAGGLLGYFAVAQDPAAAYALTPAEEFRQPGATREQLIHILRSGRENGDSTKFAFAAMLFSHNFKVALLALATGILAGFPTVLLMIYNGMILGCFAHLHHSKGIYGELWAWLLPHGVSELWAIILCGGVGLMIGKAVLAPGLRTRAESLRLAGRDAVAVSLGAGVMLLLAAWAESYIRQSNLSQGARFLFAGATFIFWSIYFAWGAIKQKPSSEIREV